MQRKHGSYERSINEIACGGTRELFVYLYISYRVSEKKMAMSVRLKPWRQFRDLFFGNQILMLETEAILSHQRLPIPPDPL